MPSPSLSKGMMVRALGLSTAVTRSRSQVSTSQSSSRRKIHCLFVFLFRKLLLSLGRWLDTA